MAKEENFPHDIVPDILVRLPVKSLLRFKAVSKPWRSLINDNDFIKRHLKLSRETHSDLHLILGDLDSEIWHVEVDSLRKAVRMDGPFQSKESSLIFIGSCNGFLCIAKSVEDVVLWNPLTNASHTLSVSPSDVNPESENYALCSIQYDFGYDPINDDYKVLRMVLAYGGVTDYFCSDVRLYCLKSNSWKKISDVPVFVSMLDDPDHSDGTEAAVCVNGVLYWANNLKKFRCNHSFIIGFDLRDEKFRGIVSCPKFEQDDFWINLAVLEGKLCLMCNHSKVHADLWVMKEHRVNESWVKLFSIVQGSPGILTPLVYSERRDKVLFAQNGKRFAWYDIKRRSLKNVKIRAAPTSFCVNVCQGTLVSPNIGIGRDERRKNNLQEKVNKNKKKRDDFLSTGFKLKL